MSFDITSLFTNVPLDETIKIILRRVYIDKKINTNITTKEVKELLHLCTKNVYFTFNGEIYHGDWPKFNNSILRCFTNKNTTKDSYNCIS